MPTSKSKLKDTIKRIKCLISSRVRGPGALRLEPIQRQSGLSWGVNRVRIQHWKREEFRSRKRLERLEVLAMWVWRLVRGMLLLARLLFGERIVGLLKNRSWNSRKRIRVIWQGLNQFNSKHQTQLKHLNPNPQSIVPILPSVKTAKIPIIRLLKSCQWWILNCKCSRVKHRIRSLSQGQGATVTRSNQGTTWRLIDRMPSVWPVKQVPRQLISYHFKSQNLSKRSNIPRRSRE